MIRAALQPVALPCDAVILAGQRLVSLVTRPLWLLSDMRLAM